MGEGHEGDDIGEGVRGMRWVKMVGEQGEGDLGFQVSYRILLEAPRDGTLH